MRCPGLRTVIRVCSTPRPPGGCRYDGAAVAGTVALILAGCSSGPGAVTTIPGHLETATARPAQTPGFPTRSPAPIVMATPGAIALGLADNRRVLFAPKGTHIRVTLAEETPGYSWSIPLSTNTNVIGAVSTQSSPNGDASSDFESRGLGEANLRSANDCRGIGCQGSSEIWEVQVIVTS